MDIFLINTNIANNINLRVLEQYKFKSFKNHKQRLLHTLTYFMLDRILEDVYNLSDRQISFVKNKPFLISNRKYISISHSNKYIALAFSDYDCGIDIELIKNRNFTKIANRMNFKCSNLKEFYIEWTKYESEFKLGDIAKSIEVYDLVGEYILTAVSLNRNEKFTFYIQN